MFPASELVEDLLLRLFANRAGVEQQDIRLLGVVRLDQPVAVLEQIAHARRVVLVHLAAVGLDVQLSAHVALARAAGVGPRYRVKRAGDYTDFAVLNTAFRLAIRGRGGSIPPPEIRVHMAARGPQFRRVW